MQKLNAITRTRINHGLEHATLNLLTRTQTRTPLVGHSDRGGFWVIGELSTSTLTETVHRALTKLKNGQEQLAIHPNCGTNLLTSGILAGLAGTTGLLGVGSSRRDKIERFPLIVLLSMLALIIARPLGPILQKHLTTSGKPGNLQITKIARYKFRGLTAHRISTQG
jgi:hypothetical protein